MNRSFLAYTICIVACIICSYVIYVDLIEQQTASHTKCVEECNAHNKIHCKNDRPINMEYGCCAC